MAETTQVKASAKWVRMSAYKVREVTALIQGKHIDEARRVLAFTPKAACIAVSKVLESAAANAEHNFQIPQEELLVKSARADEGLTIKRFRARAQGRGFRIRKRTCHINLVLERLPEQAVEAPARPRRRQRPPAPPAKSSQSADSRTKQAKSEKAS